MATPAELTPPDRSDDEVQFHPRDEISDESTELDEHEEQTGRPVRRTAGQHSNPFREPRSMRRLFYCPMVNPWQENKGWM